MKPSVHIEVKKAIVFGYPVGNMWDVYFDHRWVGRVSYNGNSLICIKGVVGQRRRVEEAIATLYITPEQNARLDAEMAGL